MADEFKRFQTVEYENIANAHFATINQVSVFFRYYLIIMSVPSFIFIWSSEGGTTIEDLLGLPNLTASIIKGILLVLPLAGLLICVYLISLKLDAILYARTVNGIRKYFYDIFSIDSEVEQAIRVLPTNSKKPSYFSWDGFLWVVVVFSMINTAYLTAYFYISNAGAVSCLQVIICILFGLLHIFIYWLMGYIREQNSPVE